MATGDVWNNARKLKSILKSIKYETAEDLDIRSLTEGSATVYLPIYHYAFTVYSVQVAEFILSTNFELYGRSDARFMEVVYKILRDVFSYKPPITKDQFFAKGFAERKIIMCTEIVQLIKRKHAELNPGPSKTAMKTGTRPKTAEETKSHSAVPKTKRPSSVREARQVVNELVSVPTDPPIRHRAPVYDQRNFTRHVAGRSDSTSSEQQNQGRISPEFITMRSSMPTTCENVSQIPGSEQQQVRISPEFITMRSNVPSTCENASQIGLATTLTYPNTPSIKDHNPELVEVVSLPRRWSQNTPDISIVDVRAQTSDSVLQESVCDTQEVKTMFKNMENLAIDLKQQFTDVVTAMRSQESKTDPYIVELENKVQQQFENLKAQIVLIDNRLQIVEMKVDSISKVPLQSNKTMERDLSVVIPSVTINDQGSSFSTQLKFLADPRVKNLSKEPVDLSLNYSPIRKATNGVDGEIFSANEDTFLSQATEEDARRSSTPTPRAVEVKPEASFLDAASRIEKMVQNTNQMLKDQPELSSLRNGVE